MTLLRMSASGAALILAVAALRALTLHRLPKRTFTALWTVALARLLIPFEIPFRFSAYTLFQQASGASPAALPPVVTSPLPAALPVGSGANVAAERGFAATPAASVSGWAVAYWIGLGLMALGFGFLYLRALREFRASLPLRQPRVDAWLAGRPCRREIRVRQSDRITSPVTYGLLRPVILMPASFDWSDAHRPDAVLTHELVHIRHFDGARKLLTAVALCIHWFNPAVWLMFFLHNRDLELRCDECAIRKLGYDRRRDYALALVQMEEEKRRARPMFSHFSQTAVERRLGAIARMRRRSLAALLAAILLTAGVTTAFATSAQANFSDDGTFGDIAALRRALQVDGYTSMSVGDFRETVGRLADEPELLQLLEDYTQDEALYALRDADDDAAFLFYVLEPLLAERWQQRDFDGAVTTTVSGDCAVLEYVMTLRILDAERLTVGAYARVPAEVKAALQRLLDGQEPEVLADAAAMDARIRAEIDRFRGELGAVELSVDLEFSYMPLGNFNGDVQAPPKAEGEATLTDVLPMLGEEAPDTYALDAADDSPIEEAEPRLYGNATEADYRSLLALMTDGYAAQTVAEFNDALLQWCDENAEAMERIGEDAWRDDIAVPLTRQERAFVTQTFPFSREENTRYVAGLQAGAPGADPCYGMNRFTKSVQAGGRTAWCNLDLQFRYHIADERAITVGERDARLSGLSAEIRRFWADSDIEALLQMDESDVLAQIQAIARPFSDGALAIYIGAEDVFFEHVDDRGLSD